MKILNLNCPQIDNFILNPVNPVFVFSIFFCFDRNISNNAFCRNCWNKLKSSISMQIIYKVDCNIIEERIFWRFLKYVTKHRLFKYISVLDFISLELFLSNCEIECFFKDTAISTPINGNVSKSFPSFPFFFVGYILLFCYCTFCGKNGHRLVQCHVPKCRLSWTFIFAG